MRVRAAVLMTSALLLGGCGGDGSPEQSGSGPDAPTAMPSPSVPSSPGEDGSAALRAAVTAYSDAVLTGDSNAAYALLSTRCERRIARAELAAAVSETGRRYGAPLPVEFVDINRAETWATVSYQYGAAELDRESERWSRESGEWRYDDCAS